MKKIDIISYAKVNLTLEVSNIRPDGYHDIDSIVQIINIEDELSISKADAGSIDVITNAKGIPSGRENIVYKAAEAFFCGTGIKSGAVFRLNKKIPSQAGLGGGSGNAAAAIMGLNQLYDAGLSSNEMAVIASSVGSDAPLFVYGGTVRMQGRGELIKKLSDAPEMHIVVVKPDVGVSTGWAYSEMDRHTGRERRIVSDNVECGIESNDRKSVVSGLWNDFDPVISDALPVVKNIKDSLMDLGAENAMLSGSGSAVFGIFESNYKAELAASHLRSSFKHVYVAKTLGRKADF